MFKEKKKTGKMSIEMTRFSAVPGKKSVEAKKIALKKVAEQAKKGKLNKKEKEMIFAAIANK